MAEERAYQETSLGRPRRCVHCGEPVAWERLLCPRCGRPADTRALSRSQSRWRVLLSVLQLAFWLALGGWVLRDLLQRFGPGLWP